MRFGFFLVPFAVAAGCGGVISGSDGGSDGAIPTTCASDSDCPLGFGCLFPVDEGCGAKRSCTKVALGCKGMPSCACDDTPVLVCGPGASKPIAHSGSCADAPPQCTSGLACEACNTAGFAVVPQVTPSQATNACSAADISTFVTACLDTSATQQTCSAWQQGDAGVSGCGACILSPMTAAAWGPIVCQANSCTINSGGCIDIVAGQVVIENGTNGSCGDLANAANQCLDYACASCTTTADSDTCTNAAEQAECKAYFDAEQTASTCALFDAGTPNTCSPQNDADWAPFINVFCGTGP